MRDSQAELDLQHSKRTAMFKTVVIVLLLSSGTLALAEEQTCRQEVGKKRAAVYVRQCIDISPATHPPCNDQNTCTLIQDEIKRGCEFAKNTEGAKVPDYCADYLSH